MGSLVEVMTGSMAEKRSDAVCGDGLMGLLQKLDHSEILEVLSGGFCKNCEAVLEDRVRALMNSKRPSSSLSHLFSRVRLDSYFFCLVACFPRWIIIVFLQGFVWLHVFLCFSCDSQVTERDMGKICLCMIQWNYGLRVGFKRRDLTCVFVSISFSFQILVRFIFPFCLCYSKS